MNIDARAATPGPHASLTPGSLASDYVELLKRSLIGTVHQDVYVARPSYTGPALRLNRWTGELLSRALRSAGWELARRVSRHAVESGRVRPLAGETMVGLARLDNLQTCIEKVVRERVAGDLIETGVWRGGASIFMRGVLRALEVADRDVWVADSFRGLPAPKEDCFPSDVGDEHYRIPELAVPVEVVKENFRRYGLLDDQVRFLQGCFSDTLPRIRDSRWALIRLDGDMYESTMDALENLYPQLSPGGFVVVDDGALPPCREAVEDFRASQSIRDPIEWIDWTGFFWRRESS